jgi:hypothetical protein
MTDYYVDITISGSSGFDYHKKVYFLNSTFTAITNIQIPIILDDTDGDYPGLESYDNIAFKDKDGNDLPWECVYFNDGGLSYYYVEVPNIEASDEDYIYMYWGGNTSVEDKENVWV